MKRKLEIDDPWEYQIAYWVRRGVVPETARLATIICCANAGDLRPLQRAIAEAPKLDGSEMVAMAPIGFRLMMTRRVRMFGSNSTLRTKLSKAASANASNQARIMSMGRWMRYVAQPVCPNQR